MNICQDSDKLALRRPLIRQTLLSNSIAPYAQSSWTLAGRHEQTYGSKGWVMMLRFFRNGLGTRRSGLLAWLTIALLLLRPVSVLADHTETIRIPVKIFHIGDNAPNMGTVQGKIDKANAFLKDQHIELYLADTTSTKLTKDALGNGQATSTAERNDLRAEAREKSADTYNIIYVDSFESTNTNGVTVTGSGETMVRKDHCDQTIAHELLHSMGLSHNGDGTVDANGDGSTNDTDKAYLLWGIKSERPTTPTVDTTLHHNAIFDGGAKIPGMKKIITGDGHVEDTNKGKAKTDPKNDVRSKLGGTIIPGHEPIDLVSSEIRHFVQSDNFYMKSDVAVGVPATSATSIRYGFLINSDDDLSTGGQFEDFAAQGVDYVAVMEVDNVGRQAYLLEYAGGSWTNAGSLSYSVTPRIATTEIQSAGSGTVNEDAGDTVEVVVPAGLLSGGNDPSSMSAFTDDGVGYDFETVGTLYLVGPPTGVEASGQTLIGILAVLTGSMLLFGNKRRKREVARL